MRICVGGAQHLYFVSLVILMREGSRMEWEPRDRPGQTVWMALLEFLLFLIF